MYDVAIIGGGPAGSTAGSLLKKYSPNLEVAIFERETFPREHVGESQLPPISSILDEMGCWGKVEAAGFPIKVGATYRWGASPGLWDFYFVPQHKFRDEPRPAKYQGQRLQTAFQVDRAKYDKILLDHAAELGCIVHQGTAVKQVAKDGDRVEHLTLADGNRVHARHYVDASGGGGILRKAMGVNITEPAKLQNIAVWDYWENAEWATEIGVGGTMVQIMSIATGWIWFIPLSPTRTSIGFICPAEHYKNSGKTTKQLYLEALPQDELIQSLTKNATREGQLQATKDWSFLADKLTGENWFLAGESAGFADPILAAGMTLTQCGARELAYIILELERGEHSPNWLKSNYENTQKQRITQHIRFADFWYAANGQFTDLQNHTAKIAQDAGLKLTPEAAFQWLGTGGFVDEFAGQVGIGGLDISAIKQVTGLFLDGQLGWQLNRYNSFKLNLVEAEETNLPIFQDGRITSCKCYSRDGNRLPVTGLNELLIQILLRHSDISEILGQLTAFFKKNSQGIPLRQMVGHAFQPFEVMVAEGWVTGSFDPTRPRLDLKTPRNGESIRVR